MSSSSFTARLIAVARRALPWLVGPVVLALRGRSLELVDPTRCPGVLELISIAPLRLRPDLEIGQLFNLLQLGVMAASLAAFAELVYRRTQRLVVALATATAVGLSPLFPASLAPPWEAAAFGLCAAIALFASPRLEQRSDARATAPIVGLAVAVAVAILVPVSMLTRSLSAQSLRACAVPVPTIARSLETARSIGSWGGPFVLALAALGAFIDGWRRTTIAALIAVSGFVLASGAAISIAVAAAPLAVLSWWLAAVGLDELMRTLSHRLATRIVAAVILVLLPALAASRRVNEERDDRINPRGHERQTLRQTVAVLNLVPQQAAFVEEDATVDVLLRAAAFGGRRRAKPIAVVSPDPDAVARALGSHAVFAFPRRQEDLSLRGFVVEPVVTPQTPGRASGRLDGVAAITGRRSCQRVGPTWADFTGVSDRFALSADSEAARGPAVIYLAGPGAGAPRPDGWSQRMLRGFGYLRLDQLTPAGSDRLRAEARAVGLPLHHPILAEPFVIRFNLHRTPRAPLTLPVILGARFPAGVVKLDDAALDAGRLTVCDAPLVAISPLPARN